MGNASMCGCVLISVFSGRRYVDMGIAGDMWVFAHFGVQREEKCEDGNAGDV